jgi:ketosteroid isomerase-like protein
MSTTAEAELREVIAERVTAVLAKNPGPLAERQADDIVLFDVLPPLFSNGKADVVDKTQAWFNGYASDIGYEVHELGVRAEGDLGFCWFAYHVTGTLQSGDEVDMWVRASLCCQKSGGEWKIVHDHESVPFDPSTGQAAIDLAP